MIHSVAQFNEKHKWCGALGIVEEYERVKAEGGEDYRVLIGIPILKHDRVDGLAYIYSMRSDREFEVAGPALFAPRRGEDD